MCLNLLNNVGIKNKSDVPEIVPDHLVSHFIRGYFDGDGCISIQNKNNKITGIFNIMFNEKSLANKIQSILVDKLKISKTKINERTGSGDVIVYVLSNSGINDLRKIRDFLYKDATIFLERKCQKFSQI